MLRGEKLGVVVDGAPLLRQVSLALEAGEVLAVLGPNGAGKTTLLRVLAGELRGEGEVWLGASRLSELGGLERARRLAVLRQENEVGFAYSVIEVVGFGRIPFGDRGDEAIRAALERFDVEHLAGRSYPTLSGGEKRRVHLARVWAQVHGVEDAVLLLDEPLAALDLRHQEQVLRAMRARAQAGAAVLWVAHDLSLASLAADRVALLECGELRASGAPREVLTAERVRQVFGVSASWAEHQLVLSPDLSGENTDFP